jgi:hypothetical protein
VFANQTEQHLQKETTGIVRGLLCNDCNLRIVGVVDEHRIKVERALEYIDGVTYGHG